MADPWNPPWQPNWADVRFDDGAARRAENALNETAARMTATTNERRKLATTARKEWKGRFRHDFDKRFDSTVRESDRLVHDLHAEAGALHAAGVRARDDQAHRVADRNRWNAENEANHQDWLRKQQQPPPPPPPPPPPAHP